MGDRGPLPKTKDNKPPGVQFAPGIPAPPKQLCKLGREEYRRITKELAGRLQQVDYSLVVTYAARHAEELEHIEALRDEGPTIDTAKGVAANPRTMALQRCVTHKLECMDMLGITPGKRARQVPIPPAKPDTDKPTGDNIEAFPDGPEAFEAQFGTES